MSTAAAPIALGCAALALLAMSQQDRKPRLVWNVSASVPVGVYAVVPLDRPRVGDLVAVRPSADVAAWLDAMGYMDRDALLLKRIAAGARATICRQGRTILIDGTSAARARSRDRIGRPLPSWQDCQTLGDGEVFLLNASAPASLDGRYFGPTDAGSIIGRALPLWTKGG